MRQQLERLFVICLLLSLVLALVMVVMQGLGLVIGNGALIVQTSELLVQPTIILAAVFSGIAFILGYFPAYKENNEGG